MFLEDKNLDLDAKVQRNAYSTVKGRHPVHSVLVVWGRAAVHQIACDFLHLQVG
jgi:hypothetical protein